jgi:hypothetical protein
MKVLNSLFGGWSGDLAGLNWLLELGSFPNINDRYFE